MNRVNTVSITSSIAVFVFAFVFSSGALAQTASPTPETKPEAESPFLEKAPPLPAGMKGSDPADPRAKLKPGLFDAGEAAMGLKHLLLLKKPEAFLLGSDDPDSPRVQNALSQIGVGDAALIPKPLQLVYAQLAFANSDIAFQGDRLFMGNFYGVNIYDISSPSKASLLTSIICPGGQGDVSVHNNLLFMSVEMPNGRLDCGTGGFAAPAPAAAGTTPSGNPAADKDRFRGVRIFDISDIRNPRQVAAVQTCRGSHTHTLVVDPNDKKNVYIYVSGTSFVRQSEELAGCSDGPPDKDPNTSLFRIDVIKVPLAAPQQAAVVSSPRIFSDPKTGVLNALMDAGAHGSEKPTATDQCHDITVYPAIGLAAGACSGNGILLDIKDPANPKRIDAVNDKNYAYWHSASFSNDGKKVVFTDEWGGGMGARCRETDPNVWGANAIFNLKGNKLNFASYYKMPSAQGNSENCVAHNGSLIPVPGRDIKVQAWYQGGISVMDFTDPAKPFEIAYFDRGPIDPNVLMLAGPWSAYWYNGNVYASEIARGLDIFELVPSTHLTQNEIDAAKSVRVAELNVQNQQMIDWPNKLVVAKAYLDQLERTQALTADRISAIRRAIQKTESSPKGQKERKALAGFGLSLESDAKSAKNASDASRLRALALIVKRPEF